MADGHIYVSDEGDNVEKSDDANNDTFIENDDLDENGSTQIDSPNNEIDFDDDLDLQISSINANNEEDDNGDEVLQLAIKRQRIWRKQHGV